MTRARSSLSSDTPPKVVLCGACMSGNIGGPALYISLVEALTRSLPKVKVAVLSKYPTGDRIPSERRGWELVDMRTIRQLVLGVPLGILAMLLRSIGLPVGWLYRGAFKPYADGDVLVDMSGIAFSDDRRGSGLLINALWLVPALGTGIPIVRASQAMGPFKDPLVRWTSRFFLKRSRIIVARGSQSASYVRSLLPDRTIEELPDSAFSLEPASADVVDSVLAHCGLPRTRAFAAIGPSHVVDTYVRSVKGSDLYAETMAAAVETIRKESGLDIVLIAHESKNEAESDLAVCKAVADRLGHPDYVHILEGIDDPQIVKGVCGRAEIAVGSRFHFLVATLSSGVPSLAVTWSHKYKEMMRMVGQERYAIAYADLSMQDFKQAVRELWTTRDEIRETLSKTLPEVIAAARRNAELVAAVLASSRRKG